MFRIAILEKEQVAKDIIFELAKVFGEIPWNFAHFTKISEFAKADQKQNFDMVFFNEMFYTQRVSTSFVENHTQRIVVYCMDELQEQMKDIYPASRIIFMNRTNIKQEIQRIHRHIKSLMRAHEEYVLTYNNVFIPLRIQDIFYIEKNEKNLIYHTKRGEFRERKTMAQAETHFTPYDFIRIHASYMVNVQYIAKIEIDIMELHDHTRLPVARARKKEVVDWFHAYVKQ